MFDPIIVAKAYSQVWSKEYACDTWGGMILHARHPLSMQSEDPVPHALTRRTKALPTEFDDVGRFDRDIIWRIKFHFWGESRCRDLTDFKAAQILNRSNATLVTAVARNSIVQDGTSRNPQPLEPRHFEIVGHTGDPDQISRDLLVMRLYVK